MRHQGTESGQPVGGVPKAFVIVLSTLACLLTLLYVLHSGATPPAVSRVRVSNGTGAPLHGVTVNGVTYGDIAVGGSTGYREMTGAYRYANLRMVMEGTTIHLSPDDYVGETPLGEGRFTYRIVKMDGVDTGPVEILAVRDAD